MRHFKFYLDSANSTAFDDDLRMLLVSDTGTVSVSASAHNVDSFWPVFLPFATAKQLAELIRDFAAVPHCYPAAMELRKAITDRIISLLTPCMSAALEEAWAPEPESEHAIALTLAAKYLGLKD